MTKQNQPLIYSSLVQAVADCGLVGVAKDGTNSFQKWNFRSIDSIRKTLNPILAKNNLVIVPFVQELEAKYDGKTLHVRNLHTFTVYAVDGSSVQTSVVLANSGNDPSKIAGQSASYSFKTAVIDLFCIPVEGATDIDERDENGKKTSFMPKVEVNKAGVTWSEPDWSKGQNFVMEWCKDMTGKDPKAIMENTKADKDGKKGFNFAATTRKIWAAN